MPEPTPPLLRPGPAWTIAVAAALMVAPTGDAVSAESTASAAGSHTVVIANFSSGADGAAIHDERGTLAPGLGTVAAVKVGRSSGDGDGAAAVVTLKGDSALLKLPLPVADWSGYRTLLVDVTSTRAIDAGAARLVTKSGAGRIQCSASSPQAVAAGASVTYSFRLDWQAMACRATPDKAAVKEAYIQLGGGSGNTVTVDNVRITKAVRVMALGDSITAAPEWREALEASLTRPGAPWIDMVGTMGDNGAGWDSDHEGHGCILAAQLAAATRDSVIARADCPTHDGNLEVWLEQSRPDLVLMNLGTNDVWNGAPIASIVAAFDTLLAQMRANNPRIRLLVAQILPMAPPGCPDCTPRALALNKAIERWANCARKPLSPVSAVDLATGWDAATMTDDGVHPNSAGAAALAAHWLAAVRAGIADIDIAGEAAPGNCNQ